MWLTMLASAMLANDSTYRSSSTVSGATATQIFSIMIISQSTMTKANDRNAHIFTLLLQVAITTPEGGSWSYPHIKISHPAQERLAMPPGCTSPILFEQWGGFFYVPQEPGHQIRRGTRINTDWFPKRGPEAQTSGRGVWAGSPKNVFRFLTPLIPLSWVSESFRRAIGQISTWKAFFPY